jgi:hypothetical protein
MGALYRDPTLGLQRRMAELIAWRSAELDELDPALVRVYARRTARIAAGMVGFVGMSAVFAAALAHWLQGGSTPRYVGMLAIAVWVATPLTYLLSRWRARHSFQARLDQELFISGELHRDIGCLASATVAERGVRMTDRLERASAAWPLMGAALVVPILLHFTIYGLHSGELPAANELGLWIGLSALTVLHCHYVLAYQAWCYSRALSEHEEFSGLDTRGMRALAITVASSVLPGAVLAGIPCVLVVLTGLVFVPAAFSCIARRLHSERVVLVIAIGQRPALKRDASD